MKTINLLKDKTQVTSNFNLTNATSTGISFDQEFAKNTVDTGAIVKRLVALALFPVVLMAYEAYNMNLLTAKLEKLNVDIQKVNDQIIAFGPKVRDLRKFEEEEKKLKTRVDTIIDLSKERLANVKALDALHELVPEKSWITEMSISSRTFEILGLATEPLIVSTLIGNFEESIFFTNIKLEYTEEIKNKKGVLNKFKVIGSLGEL